MGKYGWHGDIESSGFDPDIASAEARFKGTPAPEAPKFIEYEGRSYLVSPCCQCEAPFNEAGVQACEDAQWGTKTWTCPECGKIGNRMPCFPAKPEE